MNKTAIEWCDYSWNPVTGCLHGCPYCYARKIAKRFGTLNKSDILPEDEGLTFIPDTPETFCELETPHRDATGKIEPYPANFYPTFHRYRLGEPARIKEPKTVFVCSMADLFGKWVPETWITEVFAACKEAPWHTYLFLTKNPDRYDELADAGKLPEELNFWYGSTTPTQMDKFWWSTTHNTFGSIEPMLEAFDKVENPVKKVDWIIIGAETGNRSGKVVPKREWVENMVENCRATGTPVFMKDSLIPIVGEENMKRELPAGVALTTKKGASRQLSSPEDQ